MIMIRKIVLLVLLLFLVTSCTNELRVEEEKPYIVFAAPFDSQPVWDKAKSGFLRACEDYNFYCDWNGPTFISTDYMGKVIHEGIMKKADGIITQGVIDPSLLDLAKEASIPVVLVDSDINDKERLGFFVKDFDKQAELLVDNIRSKIGNRTMNIAVQVAEMNFDIAKQQIAALEEAMKKYGSNHKIVVVSESKSDPIKARSRWREVLEQEKSINIIVNFAGESAKEAALVVEELEREGILIYGVDEMTETLDMIKEGKIEGTIVTSFFDYGYNSVRLIYNHIKNYASTEDSLAVKLELITKDNIDEYSK